MSESDKTPRVPKGMGPAGTSLWKRLVAEYDFSDSVEGLITLESAARTADCAARLQAAIDAQDEIRVRGSQGQPTLAPEWAELRQTRNLLNTLLRSLNLPGSEESDFLANGKMTRSAAGKKAAAARWGRAG